MRNHKLLKIKGKDYYCICRDCGFSDVGKTYNVVKKAKKHAIQYGHSVEYYTENGKVYRFINI